MRNAKALEEELAADDPNREEGERTDMVYDWKSVWKRASDRKKGSLASFFLSPSKRVENESGDEHCTTLITKPAREKSSIIITPDRNKAGLGKIGLPFQSHASSGGVMGMFAKHTGVKRSCRMSTSKMLHPVKKIKYSDDARTKGRTVNVARYLRFSR